MNVTPELIGAVVGLFTIGGMCAYQIGEMSKLKFMVKLLWEAHMRKAERGILRSGMGKRNSPLYFTKQEAERIAAIYGPLMDQLRDFYAKHGQHKSSAWLFAKIESMFGKEMEKAVAGKLDLDIDECTAAALAIVRACPPLLN